MIYIFLQTLHYTLLYYKKTLHVKICNIHKTNHSRNLVVNKECKNKIITLLHIHVYKQMILVIDVNC